jgi:tetratricopeptide (TPR) repeat protein
VRARALLNGHLDSEIDNLEKGTNLLEESVAIQPRLFEARIYLGHARNLGGDLEGACEEFRAVLRAARALLIRGFALENLGNVYLQMGELADAGRCFRRVVKSEIITAEPRFFTSWFNLGLTYALQGDYPASVECFASLYDGYRDKHPAVSEILAANSAMVSVFAADPEYRMELERRFPGFFGRGEG